MTMKPQIKPNLNEVTEHNLQRFDGGSLFLDIPQTHCAVRYERYKIKCKIIKILILHTMCEMPQLICQCHLIINASRKQSNKWNKTIFSSTCRHIAMDGIIPDTTFQYGNTALYPRSTLRKYKQFPLQQLVYINCLVLFNYYSSFV